MPGATASGAIDLLTRSPASGTADAFQQIFLGQNLHISGTAVQKDSNGLVQESVHADPNAIGFVSLYFTSGVHPVAYQGVPCTLRNAKSGQYGGVRNFWMVTRGRPTRAAASFLHWVTTSSKARSIINTSWIAIH